MLPYNRVNAAPAYPQGGNTHGTRSCYRVATFLVNSYRFCFIGY